MGSADHGSDNPQGATSPQPFPSAEHIAPWIAVSWRAFGYYEAPAHIARHRSFDSGDVQLPDEEQASYEVRQKDHQRFDAAERELLALLASGNVTAKGQEPARGASGKRLYVPAPEYSDIPASTFLKPELAFSADGELIQRLPMLDRIRPPYGLRGSNADPSFPLYYDVLVEAKELRKVWEPAQVPKTNQSIFNWLTDAAETFLRSKSAKPKRDDLVRDCVAALGCRYEDAEVQYKQLPDHLRRQRGERNKPTRSAG